MTWIEKIRQKSPEQKMRLVWAAVIVSVVVLVALWVVSSRFSRNVPKDTSLFDTIGQGFRDVQNNLKTKK